MVETSQSVAAGSIRLLLVDDDSVSLRGMEAGLRQSGMVVAGVEDGDTALKLLAENEYDALVSDIRLHQSSGLDLLASVREIHPGFPVILITAFDSLETAIQAVKLGATDYILKPFQSINDLVVPILRAVEEHRLREQNRQLQRQLADSEAKFRTVLENSLDIAYRFDLDRECLDYVSPSCLRILGYNQDDLISLDMEGITVLLHPDDRKLLAAFAVPKDIGMPGQVSDPIECRVICRSGEYKWLHITFARIRDVDDQPPCIVGNARDITDNKNAQAALETARVYIDTIIRSLSDALVVLDGQARIEFVNQKACDLCGYVDGEMIGSSFLRCFEETRGMAPPPSAEAVFARRKELTLLGSSGQKIPVSLNGALMPGRTDEANRVVCLVRDIRQERIARQKLVQAAKMASLGELVAGASHEINNPNGLILLSTPLLCGVWEAVSPILDEYYRENGDFSLAGSTYSGLRDQIPELFAQVQDSAERIRKIVDDLKHFSQNEDSQEWMIIDLNDVVREAVKSTLHELHQATHHFQEQYHRQTLPVRANAMRLESVFINLIQNACQSLAGPERGIFLSTFTRQEDRRVIIQLEDQGCGIRPELLPLIEDPFFTTKRKEGGTGLGLSISSAIIKGHGGRIRYDSQCGVGTTVIVELPAADI